MSDSTILPVTLPSEPRRSHSSHPLRDSWRGAHSLVLSSRWDSCQCWAAGLCSMPAHAAARGREAAARAELVAEAARYASELLGPLWRPSDLEMLAAALSAGIGEPHE